MAFFSSSTHLDQVLSSPVPEAFRAENSLAPARGIILASIAGLVAWASIITVTLSSIR